MGGACVHAYVRVRACGNQSHPQSIFSALLTRRWRRTPHLECVGACVGACVRACVHMRARARARVCVCVCVCVCVFLCAIQPATGLKVLH